MTALIGNTESRLTAAMREAIACADVGDEQRGEDMTVNQLQESVEAVPNAAATPTCANCGAELLGEWCAECAQESISGHSARRTLHRQWERVRLLIVALVVHPGLLTAEFRDGQRARSNV
jgi:Beta-eliminating lyase